MTAKQQVEGLWVSVSLAVEAGMTKLSGGVLVAHDSAHYSPPALTAALRLHFLHVPLIVADSSSSSGRNHSFQERRGRPLKWPCAILLPLTARHASQPRAHLLPLLIWLRSGAALAAGAATTGAFAAAPWHAGAHVYVVGTQMPRPRAVQRALARADLLHPVVGLTGCRWAFLYFPAPRPELTPQRVMIKDAVTGEKFLRKFPGHSILYAVYTKKEEEPWCLENNNWSWAGFSKILADLAEERLHARPVCWSHVEDLTGVRYPNGTYTELIGGVVKAHADVLLLSARAFPEWEEECDLLYPHYTDDFCLWVRKAGMKSFSESLIGAFQDEVWVTTGAALAALGLVRVLAERHNLQRRPDACAALLETLRAFLVYTGMYEAPYGHGGGIGALTSAIALTTATFGLVLLSIFQGTFTSLLATPEPLRDIATLREAGEHLRAAYTYADWPEQLRRDTNPNIQHFAKKLYPVDKNWYRVVEDILKFGDVGLLMNAWHAKYFLYWKGYGDDGYTRMHKVPECVLTGAPLYYAMRKNSPYFPALNELVRHTLEAGLHEAWESQTESLDLARFQLQRPPKGGEVLRPYALHVAQLQGTFTFYAWGLVVSGAVLLLEIAWTYIRGFAFVHYVLRKHSRKIVK